MGTFRILLAATGLFCAGNGLAAELVVFRNGKALTVQSHRVDNMWLYVQLPGGGELAFPQSLVLRVTSEDGITVLEPSGAGIVKLDEGAVKDRDMAAAAAAAARETGPGTGAVPRALPGKQGPAGGLQPGQNHVKMVPDGAGKGLRPPKKGSK